MKKIIFTCIVLSCYFTTPAQDTTRRKLSDTLMLENIEVTSIRATDKAPFTKTNIK
jgi:hypothetical protein